MGIKVKAIERNVAFEKGKQKWAYVMQADLYGQLTQSKVIEEAAVRSGLAKQVINAAWGAIGAVITAWATEGHSVAVPGLGSLRFGLNSTAVEDVNKVSSSLINRRYIIFVPNADIKEELAKTSVNITCYDRNGKIVKQVTSADKNDTGKMTTKITPTREEVLRRAVELRRKVAEPTREVIPAGWRHYRRRRRRRQRKSLKTM